MVGQALWKNLKNLVEIDQQIKKFNQKIKHSEKILKKDQLFIPNLQTQQEEQETELTNAKKNGSEQEIVAKEIREKESKEKKVLEKITNEKEYKAFEKELKTITQQRIEQEDLLVKAWHNLETVEKKVAEKKEEILQKIKQLEEGIQAQVETLKDLNNQKETVVKNRQEALKIIPEEWLNKYERMIHRVSDPIVPVMGESCSACYYTILRQDLQKLKKSGVLPCRNCYRFLYYNEKEEEENKKESF
jgi:predicted  nucleic acid-binding Zn-ribbon protein